MGRKLLERRDVQVCVILSGRGEMSACEIGSRVFPERAGRVSAPQGGGDYAAQMLLGRMRARHLVDHARSEGSTRWCITSRGSQVAELAAKLGDAKRRENQADHELHLAQTEVDRLEQELIKAVRRG